MKDAPLVESRVCPYENSPDGNFIFEQHPENKKIWFWVVDQDTALNMGRRWGELVARTLVV